MKENTLNYINKKWWYRLLKVFYVFIFLFIFILWIYIIYEDNWIREINFNNSKVICYSPEDRFFESYNNHLTIPFKDDKWVYIWAYISDKGIYDKLSYKDYIKDYTLDASVIAIMCIDKVNNNSTTYKAVLNKDGNINKLNIIAIQKKYELRYWLNRVWNFNYDPILKKTIYIDSDKEKYEEWYDNFITELTSISSDKEYFNLVDYSIRMFDIKLSYSYWKFIWKILFFIITIYIFFELFKRIFYYIVLWTFLPKKDI